jgi:hypothetical protein
MRGCRCRAPTYYPHILALHENVPFVSLYATPAPVTVLGSAYPHGGCVTAALIVASGAGLAATCYGAMSCRFLKLTYDAATAAAQASSSSSSSGCFEEAFLPDITGQTDEGSNQEPQAPCQVGIGMYQWLQQSSSSTSTTSSGSDAWSKGSCVGYQESMLAQISDLSFSLSRGFGVFAVLMSFVVLLWNVMLACIELNWIQVYLRRLCSFLLVVSCGLAFLLERSDVCSDHFPGSSCALDQGAMAMMAACILWFCDLLMTSVWIKSSRVWKPMQGRWNRRHRGREDLTDREDEDEELARAARAARYASAVTVYHPNDTHLQRISPTSGSADRASYQEQLPPASMSTGASFSGSSVAASAAAKSARNGDGASKGRIAIPTSFSYAARNPDDSAGASPPSKSSRSAGRNRQQPQQQQSPSSTRDEHEVPSRRTVVTVDDASSKEQLEVILDNIERQLHDDDK